MIFLELALLWRDVFRRQERLEAYLRHRAAWLRCRRELRAQKERNV